MEKVRKFGKPLGRSRNVENFLKFYKNIGNLEKKLKIEKFVNSEKKLEIRKKNGNLENLKLEIDNWKIDFKKVNFYHYILLKYANFQLQILI